MLNVKADKAKKSNDEEGGEARPPYMLAEAC